jgi:tRNA threonylcarbamoyl adenosine modification protein YeaZ
MLAEQAYRLLRENNLTTKDLTRIGFINGPGSFTGLRIGLAFAKGFAFGSTASLIPLKAHSVLRQSYLLENHAENPSAIVYPGYERNSLYVSSFDIPENISLIAITDLLKMRIRSAICLPQLQDISIPRHIISIELKTMALMAYSDEYETFSSESLAVLEPFYGIDFKPFEERK